MLNRVVYFIVAAFALLSALTLAVTPTVSQAQTMTAKTDTFSAEEIVRKGGEFFGSVTKSLAELVEKSVSEYGQPNAYILGDEAGGALFAGARFGEGTMYTRNQGEHPVYWQGPSLGFDVGGDGSKVMMLVYNLPSVQAIFTRYPGVDGSAYAVGGLGMTVMKSEDVVLVPIRSGVGARLGINVGYLKFTDEPTWNPF